MWPRRARFLVISVVALAIGLLLIRPRPEHLVVIVLYDTNAPSSYAVEVVNGARTLQDFTAWTEYKTNGIWTRLPPPYAGRTLKPTGKEVFTLPKPQHAKARIAVFHGRISRDERERWMNRIKALVGVYPKLQEMYVDAP